MWTEELRSVSFVPSYGWVIAVKVKGEAGKWGGGIHKIYRFRISVCLMFLFPN